MADLLKTTRLLLRRFDALYSSLTEHLVDAIYSGLVLAAHSNLIRARLSCCYCARAGWRTGNWPVRWASNPPRGGPCWRGRKRNSSADFAHVMENTYDAMLAGRRTPGLSRWRTAQRSHATGGCASGGLPGLRRPL